MIDNNHSQKALWKIFLNLIDQRKNYSMPLKKENKPPLKPQRKPFGFSWLFYLLLFNLAIFLLLSRNKSMEEISWNTFRNNMLLQHDVDKVDVVNKEIVEVYIKKDSLTKQRYKSIANLYKNNSNPGPEYYFHIGSLNYFERKLDDAQAGFPDSDKVSVTYTTRQNWWSGILSWVLPLILLVFFFYYSRRMSGGAPGGSSIFDFGKTRDAEYSKAKLSPVTFKDVAGYDEAKMEVMEIVEFLKQPGNFTKLGAKIPKGVLLVGPPGSGKTLLAKAVAGEAAVPFFSLSGSEFIEIFVGVGASRVRDLFNKAKQKAPSIIFIDEIDTIGRIRGRAMSAQANDERDSTLNQLLTEMDGFAPNTGVIVMAATNRADILDPALLRAGRFDRHIYLELPNKTEREAIFNVHLKPLKMDTSVNSAYLAGQTPGFSGADIANVCNEAALIAARHKKEAVDKQDFYDAIDRIIAGMEKKSKIITPSEKKVIAYHEAGHAITSWMLKHIDPLVKVSIIPRGKSLGSAWYLPEEHQIITLAEFNDQLCAALGGRVAEEIVFGDPSSGALDDLEKVTKQAYMMVANLGLNPQIGSMSYYDSTGTYENTFQKPFSEATAQLIDIEVRKLIEQAHKRTTELLLGKRAELDKLAQLLLEKEVVYKEDIEVILGKRNIS
jgi:AFG3 family protein